MSEDKQTDAEFVAEARKALGINGRLTIYRGTPVVMHGGIDKILTQALARLEAANAKLAQKDAEIRQKDAELASQAAAISDVIRRMADACAKQGFAEGQVIGLNHLLAQKGTEIRELRALVKQLGGD